MNEEQEENYAATPWGLMEKSLFRKAQEKDRRQREVTGKPVIFPFQWLKVKGKKYQEAKGLDSGMNSLEGGTQAPVQILGEGKS